MTTGGDTQETVERRAADAVAVGEWQRALAILRDAAAERELSSPEVEVLAQAAYGSGDLEAALSAWELLHTRCTAAGDVTGAARAATTVALYLMMDSGLMAPVRGWATRAERLLDGQQESDVHAWLALVRTYERFLSGDMDAARVWAQRAIAAGERHGAPAPCAIARVAVARLVILDGDVEEGLRLLDEAAVATVSGAVDPLTVGMIYCELICAMQGLAQYDRAEEWTEAMERWRHGNAFGGINGRCRVHRAEILRLRGSCLDAEEEALRACEELRPWMRREFGWPLTELGTIRLRKGDLGGAEEAFLAAHGHGWDPQPGLALLRLAQGEAAAAAELIGHALDHPANIPSKERPPHGQLRRAPLLEAQVEIALAAGDLDTAHGAAGEVSQIAATFRSRALEAGAALARGRVALAAGELAAAAQECEQAVIAWCDVGAPYESSVARLVLAEAHDALGNRDAARIEVEAARSAFERIGAKLRAEEAAGRLLGEGRGPATISPADASGPRAVTQVFRLEGDTRTVTFEGETVLLRDLKGMRYIERLLAEPGREFHALDLVVTERGVLPEAGHGARRELDGTVDGDAGPLLDAEAKAAFRRRLEEIEDDIEEAVRHADSERAARAQADKDYLVRELSRAVGLGGRDRTFAGNAERARTSVTRSIRYAMERIAEHLPALGEHLERTLRTGTYCSYAPDPRAPARWEF